MAGGTREQGIEVYRSCSECCSRIAGGINCRNWCTDHCISRWSMHRRTWIGIALIFYFYFLFIKSTVLFVCLCNSFKCGLYLLSSNKIFYIYGLPILSVLTICYCFFSSFE